MVYYTSHDINALYKPITKVKVKGYRVIKMGI
jgi:hypothetical protein